MGAGLSAPSSHATLPQPGLGVHPVGVVDVMTADGGSGDSGIFARIFYPAEPDSATFDILSSESDARLPSWIERKEYIASLLSQLKSVSRRAHWLAEWIIGERKIRCVWRAPLASNATIPNRLPVIIFSHGLGSSRHQHSSLCAALASHGYIVAAIEHRDYSACWTYRILTDTAITSTVSCGGLKGRPAKQEKAVTLLEIADADSRRETKTRSQQVHKRVAELVRLLHFLEEAEMGAVRGSGCSCYPSTSSSSSSACSSASSASSSSDEGRRASYSTKIAPPKDRCFSLRPSAPGPEDEVGSRLVLGESWDWRQLQNRLDLNDVTVVGHGLGGAAALAACSFTTDFTRGIVLDGWMRPLDADVYLRVDQPILFLNRPGGDTGGEVQARFPGAESITLMDAETYTFGDLSLLLRPFVGRRLRLNGATDAEQMAATVVSVCVAFLSLGSLENWAGTPEGTCSLPFAKPPTPSSTSSSYHTGAASPIEELFPSFHETYEESEIFL